MADLPRPRPAGQPTALPLSSGQGKSKTAPAVPASEDPGGNRQQTEPFEHPPGSPVFADRIRGAIWGLLVGDALGVPYEFHEPSELPGSDMIEMSPPAWFDRAHQGTPPGTWSDDGAHALCLLASLLKHGRFDPEDFAGRLLAWHEKGYMAVDGRVFDCGVQTGQALAALRAGESPLKAGPRGEYDNGNGALMRVLPLALWHGGPDPDLVELAHQQSQITHGHARSQVCCALYCLWARRIVIGEPSAWDAAVGVLRGHYGDSLLRSELEDHVRPDDPSDGGGSGYVVDTLRTVRFVMERPSFDRIVREAIAHGRDTDTTACIAGGLAGARHGIACIPPRWLAALRGRDLAAPLIEQLVARRNELRDRFVTSS